jgi:HAD superfamily hydrolase (TIGR01490 family)|uniref:HAD-IB family hydrolase n=1 Tax=Desulfobacca acetoxidans TaxID=60893 RepID=A0A7C3SJ68_9BACT
MGTIAAIFDVDMTLVQGSTERLFFQYLLRHNMLKATQAMAYLARLASNPEDRFRDKSYLRGLPVKETEALARQCYAEMIAPRLIPQALACLREHKAKGHRIVLLTGSLSFLIRPLKEMVGADWLIATEPAHSNGCFTGEIAGLHPRGKNKELLLYDLSRRQGLDLSQSYAYADHFEDRSLFGQVGYPVVVNPSWRLKRLARKHRWPIRYF